MEWTWKKLLGVCVFLILLVATPVFLCSNPMMDFYQKRIDKDPDSENSRWLQLKTADICMKTMRPERAAEYYWRFLERYPEDPKRLYALLQYGEALDECNRNKDAIEVFTQVIEEYPGTEEAETARKGADRCKYVKPNR